ncbi:hypothetical protein SDRG_00466 [Saprolegnia diclina VS20]|uniref:FYVE-type domain-containing protein n=1 Tax=Saprolegnia diclina (strain VS20) TaxID=1156394 RepID=T0SBF4_SAPDV|nr:hypothetical protein SDRG_00466 [Saprolegnia diclina VS20]EQC42743.1 hypothetical protein SDRG_00466 [Saprolegnia diclina VS20]|eukprot:XP_008604166.1 hypothetical protein SDRG_00466 [Saprolegnia diclina VS20]
MALPLPADYFACPALTPKQRDAIVNFGHAACNDTVQNALHLQKARVASVVSNKKTNRIARIHKGHDAIDYTLPAVCGRTVIQATLAEIAHFFYLDSKLKLATYALIMGQTILDRHCLYTLKQPTPGRPAMHYLGVAWMAVECPTGILNRDFCVIESHDTIEVLDPTTKRLRRGWVRALHSVDLPACPSLRASHGLVRGTLLRSGHVFLETNTPGVLEYCHVMISQGHGKLPRSVVSTISKNQVARLLNLEEFLSLQRFSARLDVTNFLDVRHFQNKDTVTACSICRRKFGWFVSKKHCRQCGKIICSTCGRNWKMPINDKPVKLRICQACFCPDQPQKTPDDEYEPKLIFTAEAFESHRSLHDAIMDSLRRFDESTLVSHDESSNGDDSTYCDESPRAFPRISALSVLETNTAIRPSSFGSYLYTDTSLDAKIA